MLRAILLLFLYQSAASKVTNNRALQMQQYETNLNNSIYLGKEDKLLRGTWTVHFQVQRVNVTTKYRMQVIRHMEHSFRRTEENSKWTECLFLHRRQIRKHELQYYADEGECLTTTAADDQERTQAVEQVEKEGRKWRKGYRYLVKICNTDHPANKEAAALCLIQYMEKDNYQNVIERLMILEIEEMGKLFLQHNDSLKDLEECLNTQLSNYLGKLRLLMDSLYKCYSLTTQSNKEETKKEKKK